MQAAKTRGAKKAAAGEPPPHDARAARIRAAIPATCWRRSASAISTPCRSPPRSSPSATTPIIECANDQFRFLAEWDERLGERRIAQVPMLRSGPIGTRLAAFLEDGRSGLPVRHRRRAQHRRPPFHRPLRPAHRPARPARPLPDLADRQDRPGRDRAQPALGDAARQPDRPAQPLRLQREGRGGARRSRLPPRAAMPCSPST